MKQKTSSCKGVAMLWAVLVMLMVALIASGIIIVSRVYYVREQDENYSVQAQMYAESAIELIQSEIVGNNTTYISNTNNSQTVTVEFPDASNWICTVTISHSAVDVSASDPTQSGIIYLTVKVARNTSGSGTKELSEVCAKMKWSDTANEWVFDGYYNL
ncbi:MAG: hypothetical protein LUF89_08530 [Ruminococcus sp.]|nr:hypothetical protein [Ruminococcus sp.]